MYINSDLSTSKPNDETEMLENLHDDDDDEERLEDVEQIRARVISEEDDEWCTALQKISKLSNDDDSWMNAKEIMEPPNAVCHKIGDEARSLAARHIIDRLKEKSLLQEITAQSPRLRSAVELLSKPDADFLYPAVRFVVNQMREKYPNTYTSVISKTDIKIPQDEEPSILLVSLAKTILENSKGQIEVSWGKFIAVLALCGAVAVDSVESGYPEGITEVVETFGCLVEQFMAEWIASPQVGGWEAFIKETSYEAILPPIPRAILILSFIFFLIYIIFPYFTLLFYPISVFWGGIKRLGNDTAVNHGDTDAYFQSSLGSMDIHSEL